MAKEKKKKGKKQREKGKLGPGGEAGERARSEGTQERAEAQVSLEQAAARLGPADRSLEWALRQGHRDEALGAEGAKADSEQLLVVGEALCSEALGYLENPDLSVQLALRKVGLTRPLVALTVDLLRRLEEGPEKPTLPPTIEQAAARGSRLREEMLGRLRLIERADLPLARALAPLAARPTTAERLASQLEGLAALVRGLDQHEREEIRALVASKSLGLDDADELEAAAECLHGALARPSPQGPREAVLDLLAGLCSLLLTDLREALWAARRRVAQLARSTPGLPAAPITECREAEASLSVAAR